MSVTDATTDAATKSPATAHTARCTCASAASNCAASSARCCSPAALNSHSISSGGARKVALVCQLEA